MSQEPDFRWGWWQEEPEEGGDVLLAPEKLSPTQKRIVDDRLTEQDVAIVNACQRLRYAWTLERTYASQVQAINRAAAALAETIAPELPWPTDEPVPDLMILWRTAGSNRTPHPMPGRRRYGFPVPMEER